MGFLSRLGRKGGKAISADAFQAAVAAGVLIGAYDGKLDRDEQDKLVTVISVNDAFKAFSKSEIQKQVQAYGSIISSDARMGKLKLKKEIEDIADNGEIGEQVLITAISVAEASGSIGPEEYKALTEVAQILGLNLADFEVSAPA